MYILDHYVSSKGGLLLHLALQRPEYMRFQSTVHDLSGEISLSLALRMYNIEICVTKDTVCVNPRDNRFPHLFSEERFLYGYGKSETGRDCLLEEYRIVETCDIWPRKIIGPGGIKPISLERCNPRTQPTCPTYLFHRLTLLQQESSGQQSFLLIQSTGRCHHSSHQKAQRFDTTTLIRCYTPSIRFAQPCELRLQEAGLGSQAWCCRPRWIHCQSASGF